VGDFVVFVSADHAERDWARHERRAALARAVRERREYVLPARFDDTPLPGLLSDMVTVDLRTRTPQQFAAMIAGKLAVIATPGQLRRPGREALAQDGDRAAGRREHPGGQAQQSGLACAVARPMALDQRKPAIVPPGSL
jgi:TIR domain